MTLIELSPYIAIYGVLVFLAPGAMFLSYTLRSLMYALSNDISLFGWIASEKIRKLRKRDNYAAFLHEQMREWLFITLAMWIIGAAFLAGVLYLLYLQGVVKLS